MANANTVFSAPYNIVGPTSATETCIAQGTSTTQRQLMGLGTDIAGGVFDGHPFKLRVISQGVASGACNFTVNCYLNSGANTADLVTLTNDVLVIGSGAQAIASKSGYVFMEATLMWDSTLQALAGFWNETAGLAEIVTTPAIIKTSAAVTATNPITSTKAATQDKLQFFITHTMSANATSSKLIEFSIDRI